MGNARTLTFAILPTGDIHVLIDHDMPPADNVVAVEVTVVHPELLVIRSVVAGPLRHLLGTGQAAQSPSPRDTSRLEAALQTAERLVAEICREIDHEDSRYDRHP